MKSFNICLNEASIIDILLMFENDYSEVNSGKVNNIFYKDCLYLDLTVNF